MARSRACRRTRRSSEGCGLHGLWLTVDTAVLGRRERDVRRGYTIPPKIGPGTIVDGILHPGWTLDFITNPPIMFANVVGHDGHDEDGTDPISLAEHVMHSFDQALSWDDVQWLRSLWDGPIVLKGIQRVDDAREQLTQVSKVLLFQITVVVNSMMLLRPSNSLSQ